MIPVTFNQPNHRVKIWTDVGEYLDKKYSVCFFTYGCEIHYGNGIKQPYRKEFILLKWFNN